jgi:hypothetical protein
MVAIRMHILAAFISAQIQFNKCLKVPHFLKYSDDINERLINTVNFLGNSIYIIHTLKKTWFRLAV